MGKSTFAGDYSYRIAVYLPVELDETRSFPHKICPLRTLWRSGFPGQVAFIGKIQDLITAKELKIESNRGEQHMPVSVGRHR